MKATILMMRENFKRDFIKDVLISNGYEIIFETDDKQFGIQKCRELKPDVIIVDQDDCGEGEVYDPITVKAIRRFNKDAIIIKAAPMSSNGRWPTDTIRAGADHIIFFPAKPEDVLKALKKARESAKDRRYRREF